MNSIQSNLITKLELLKCFWKHDCKGIARLWIRQILEEISRPILCFVIKETVACQFSKQPSHRMRHIHSTGTAQFPYTLSRIVRLCRGAYAQEYETAHRDNDPCHLWIIWYLWHWPRTASQILPHATAELDCSPIPAGCVGCFVKKRLCNKAESLNEDDCVETLFS